MRRRSHMFASTVALLRAPTRCQARTVLLWSASASSPSSSSSELHGRFRVLVRPSGQPLCWSSLSGASAVAVAVRSYVTTTNSRASNSAAPAVDDEDDYDLPMDDGGRHRDGVDHRRPHRSHSAHDEHHGSRTTPITTASPAAASRSTTSAPRAEAADSPAQQRTVTVLDQHGRPVEHKRVDRFEDLADVPTWLAANLATLRYPSTTDIQAVTIPALLDGHDIVALAPTGSGKTVAFAVPVLMRLERSSKRLPTVLVLAPTRELVQQTAKVFLSLTSGTPLVVNEAYGGASREVQERRMQRGCDILIATPGRLNDFLESGVVSFDDLKHLIVDEGDRLLDMGFKPQLDQILSYMNPDAQRQTMIWSATWPTGVQGLAAAFLSRDRLMIRAGAGGADGDAQVNTSIKQHIRFATGSQEKVELLAEMIENGTIQEAGCKMIIFVERQVDTEGAANALVRRLGIRSSSVGVLHGGMAQKARDYVMHNFKTSRCRILVATDVASRGLDIPDVTVVVNFHAPKEIDAYCHRIGRTGRAGRSGDAYTFLCPTNDGALARDLVPFLQRCNMDVPEQLEQLARKHEGYGGGRDRRHSSRFGGRNRGSHRYGARTSNQASWHHGAAGGDGFRSDMGFSPRSTGPSSSNASWRSPTSAQSGWSDGRYSANGSRFSHREDRHHGGSAGGFDV